MTWLKWSRRSRPSTSSPATRGSPPAVQRRAAQLIPGLRRGPHSLLKRLRKARKEAPTEKPKVAKTPPWDVLILREMVGNVVGMETARPSTKWKSSLR